MRFALVLLALSPALWAQGNLKVYAIDVEGGKATLFVSPSGQSMLVDAGYEDSGGRDARRIVAAAEAAGVKHIDYLLITHYHHDHVGGVPQLASLLPIRTFVDHGRNFESVKGNGAVYEAYLEVRNRGHHIVVKPGDQIPIDGIRVDIVAASGEAVRGPLPGGGAPNPTCASYEPIAPDSGENSHSIGFRITFGAFRLVDLGDLYWNQEHDLVCPHNQLGQVDVYLTTHHGKKTSGSPQLVWALQPRVAIMNNGPKTGGSPQAWQTMRDSLGLLDIWQLHYATGNDRNHNSPDPFIANSSEPCAGNWIELSAREDGSFTVRNARSNFVKTYPSKQPAQSRSRYEVE